MQKSQGNFPSNYLTRIINKDKEPGAAFAVDSFGEEGSARKKSRLAVTDTFGLPSNSSHASTGKSVNRQIGAFSITGTEVRKQKPAPQEPKIIENSLEMLQEYCSRNNIDAICSVIADNMQEPRPPGDDCPEARAVSMFNCHNEVVQSSQPEDDIIPSSEPEDDLTRPEETNDLEQLLITSSTTPIDKGRMHIVDDNENGKLFGSRVYGSRVLRSQNKPLVPYGLPLTPRQQMKRSFEKQDDSDFIDDSQCTTKTKRSSTSRATPAKEGKIPELPPDYDQALDARNFETKGRKQCDETFGEMAIKGYDLYSLRTRQYVNDLIIDNYLKLVCKRSLEGTNNYRRSYAFGTFFYTMLNNGQDQDKLVSWVKQNLFDFELLFLPINQENHWYLFVVDMVKRNYFIYDSLYYGDYDSEIKQLSGFLKYYAKKINHEIEWDEWSTCPTEDQLGPTQSNGVDCGIFLCQYAEHLSRRADLDFCQRGMVNYRKIMLYELMNGELNPKQDKEISKQDGESALN